MIKKLMLVAFLLLGIGLVGIAVTANNADFSLFSLQTVAYEQEAIVSGEEITNVFIETSSTSVKVTPVDGNEFTVRLDGKVSKKLKDNLKLIVEENGGQLAIRTEMENKIQSSFGINTINVQLDVRIPAKIYEQLEIRTSSGKLTVKNIEAKKANVQSSSGTIDVSNVNVESDLKITSSSGSINVLNSGANTLYATTSSGSISLNQLNTMNTNITSSSGRVQAESVNGDMTATTSSGAVTIESDQVTGDMVVATSSGRVNVSFKETPQSLAISFRTSSGKAKVNLDGVSYERKDKTEVVGKIGTGNYRIDVTTSSGGFQLN